MAYVIKHTGEIGDKLKANLNNVKSILGGFPERFIVKDGRVMFGCEGAMDMRLPMNIKATELLDKHQHPNRVIYGDVVITDPLNKL